MYYFLLSKKSAQTSGKSLFIFVIVEDKSADHHGMVCPAGNNWLLIGVFGFEAETSGTHAFAIENIVCLLPPVGRIGARYWVYKAAERYHVIAFGGGH